MRFHKKETAQDVIVTCCVLYNIRKLIGEKHVNEYGDGEIANQIEIGQQALRAERNFQRNQRDFRFQNFLINNYFR